MPPLQIRNSTAEFLIFTKQSGRNEINAIIAAGRRINSGWGILV